MTSLPFHLVKHLLWFIRYQNVEILDYVENIRSLQWVLGLTVIWLQMVVAGQLYREGSKIKFNLKWADLEEGFGDLRSDFWYGLKAMNYLTKTGQWEMRVDYQKLDKTWSYFCYNQFSVGDASEKYVLKVGGFTGVGSDRLAYHNGRQFTTSDRDNDILGGNCAANYNSAWWYGRCFHSNFNRQPPQIGSDSDPVLHIEMKIHPKDCIIK